MRTDYFTAEEFKAYVGDEVYEGFTPESVDETQDEVIERLEMWAGSAWPTVEDPAEARSATERHDGRGGVIILRNRPVIAISSFLDASYEVSADRYDLDRESGTIDLMYGTATVFGLLPEWSAITIEYTYGATETPRWIKRPVMDAVRSLLGETKPGSGKRIPARTRSMTTGKTTIDLDNEKVDEVLPWPWDPSASAAVRSVWMPSGVYGAV